MSDQYNLTKADARKANVLDLRNRLPYREVALCLGEHGAFASSLPWGRQIAHE